ncbi:hypothetical protein ACIHJG_15285 [Streptomyces sp. NPDC052415]|uniref:hypothetical protein n=1 Tax=Streptomyces sp. NPDC052415 TaxID=3365690 RepID=UPI0037D317B0
MSDSPHPEDVRRGASAHGIGQIAGGSQYFGYFGRPSSDLRSGRDGGVDQSLQKEGELQICRHAAHTPDHRRFLKALQRLGHARDAP